MRFPPEPVGGDDTETGNLRNGEIDEDDPTLEHLYAERHVRGRDEESRSERGPKNAEVDRRGSHFATASRRARVSSYRPKRSLARSVPPTVYGRTTTGMRARSASNS